MEKLRDADLAVSSVVKESDPRLVLKDEAEKWGADSIFVGARGLSRSDRFLVGGVSSALAARGLPIGTAYAVWTGIGAVGTAIVGMILFDESREWLRLLCIGLIVAGVLGLRLASE